MMNKWLEKLYYNCPVFLQNMAITQYGKKLHKTRYGRNAHRYVAELLQTQWLNREELDELQCKKLKEWVIYADSHIPYYRSLFEERSIKPDEIVDLRQLKRIPLLEKKTVREMGRNFIPQPAPQSFFELQTSGTTGSPLTIYCDVDSRTKHYAFLTRFRSWFGIKVGMRRATFLGRIVVAPDQQKPPFWRYEATEKNLLFSSYHMSPRNLPHYYERLKSWEPFELFGYPSSLSSLAKFILENNLSPLSVRFIMTSAETLYDHQRIIIEEALGCRVSDQYSCAEMALFVSQCEHGTIHIHPEFGIVEILDSNGEDVRPGEEGEVVCTSFINRSMPLIRYRLGDRVKRGESSCACSRHFPVIEEIVGRKDDVLITPDGKPLGRLDPIFKGLEGIREAQIIQTELDRIELRIVPSGTWQPKYEEAILYEMSKRTGGSLRIDIRRVDSIPRDNNGKFRAVISLLVKRSRDAAKPG